MEAPFVYLPDERRWAKPWDVARRLGMPGVPRRWRQISAMTHECRTYELTTQEGGGVARRVQFEVSEAGWSVQEPTDVLWAANYMELHRYGKRLEGWQPRRRKEPDEQFGKWLCWRVHEVGLKDALVSLPEQPERTFAVARRELRFLESEPTPLELRLQQIVRQGGDIPERHPLRYAGWLLERGRRVRPLLGYSGQQVYIHHPFEAWEEMRQREGLSVDEALLAIAAGLSRVPDQGPDDAGYFANEDNVRLWREGSWVESDVSAMKSVQGLAMLEISLIEAAMLAAGSFREFIAQGGSATLPASAGRGQADAE